jgi:methionyl-tRNA formyltransferase
MQLTPPAVKQAALELGVEVHQPLKVKHGTLDAWLIERNVDVAIVLAYGRILPPAVLAAPRFGCINLHASLLPKYRGAAPINWALYNGETATGIALMQMDEGLDTGPVFVTRTTTIQADWDAGRLSHELATLAAEMVRADLAAYVFTGRTPLAQEHALATHAPPFGNAELVLDWTRSAVQLHNQVRAFSPRPGANSWLLGKRLRILLSEPLTSIALGTPGAIVVAEGGEVVIQTGQGGLRILRAQLEGKRELDARDLVNGRVLQVGMQLGAGAR